MGSKQINDISLKAFMHHVCFFCFFFQIPCVVNTDNLQLNIKLESEAVFDSEVGSFTFIEKVEKDNYNLRLSPSSTGGTG